MTDTERPGPEAGSIPLHAHHSHSRATRQADALHVDAMTAEPIEPPDVNERFVAPPPTPFPSAFALDAARRAFEAAGGTHWEHGTPEQRAQLVLDKATADARREATTETDAIRATVFGPVTLGEYLEAVRSFLTRYVAFPSEHEAVAIALWVAHAHVVERFETSPTLGVTSAEMRSGKTRVLDCLELLVPNPFRVVTPSEAVTYTVLAQRPRPTLLLDEADAIFGPRTAEKYEGLRAILNAGNRQGTPVLRVKLDGKRREVEAFDVYGPKAVAGIGNLPATVADRSIPIRMKRRSPGETIARFRTRTARQEAAVLVLPGDADSLRIGAEAHVPDELNDRAADSWEPLLAVADAAGGSWPTVARLAALALSGEEETPVSVGMRLLSDVRDAFGEEDHVTTGDLLRRLHEMDDAPWGDWYGSPMTARALAKLLGPYRITPVQRRLHGEKTRGYFRSDFADAWARYVPDDVPSPGTGTSGTSGTPGGNDHDEDGGRPGSVWASAPDVPDVPVPGTHTVWEDDAPLCDVCMRRKRRVPGDGVRYVCTFPHASTNDVVTVVR